MSLDSIRFLCLALTDAYIEAHFDAILAHGSDIEARIGDDDWTPEQLKAENRAYAAGFAAHGEPVAEIGEDYESTIAAIVRDL